MSNLRYTDEFKAEAVKQVNDRGYGAREVSERLGISLKSMYAWLREARGNKGTKVSEDLSREVARLKAELKRVEEDRDILKKAAAYFAKESR
jgi:transposase